MAGTTPHVDGDTLRGGAHGTAQSITVGSPAWFAWLETATSFTFAGPDGTFTARRERASSGRGGWYWRAYRRLGGVRRRAYLGKAEELSLERLHAVAATLAGVAAPPTPTLPSGTVTFLFTDIEGSTQLWEQHPDAMHAALARHDALLRQLIGAHGGMVFKSVGDSLNAAFARARGALDAALAAQRALHQEAWNLPSPLRVRMALHTCAAELREGDYFGPPLNRLARLLALGHGGQILLSRATHDLVVDELPKQTSLRALGDYQLKDLARPEPIFQCVSADLMADFPPLRTTEPATSAERTPGILLLTTKLYVPHTRSTLLSRPRLLARLNTGLERPLTLICAPAGSGKTTLLTDWLASLSSEFRVPSGRLSSQLPQPEQTQNSKLKTQNVQVAWLSLDERDQDVHQFLRYLVAALQTIAPDCGRIAMAWLESPSPPPPETILTSLVNDLALLPDPSMVVLDDYHLVRAQAIHIVLAFILDHLPPVVHLVLATREDPPLPLSRLRARGQLVEVRAVDLHFTLDEAAEFLGASMGVRLVEGQVAALVTRTEGWVAGLQLAGLALRDRADPAAFLAAFTGSHRLVADYLSAEVIDQQPAALRHFMLTTCVLNRLCAPLCDALLGRTENQESRTSEGDPGSQFSALGSETNSQALLEKLERANLFLVPLDDERRWYRYHHLFADLLRQRLRHEIGLAGVNGLYRRAYQWHERHDLPEEAVNYALAAHDWPAAAKIMEQLSTSLWTSSRHVLKWIESLPEEEVQQSPDLCMWYAGWQITCGEFSRFEALLGAAERVIRSTGQHSKLAGVYVYRALAGFLREDAQPTIESAKQAIARFDDENSFIHAPTIEKLARGYFLKGDLAEAERVWAETTKLAQAADGQRTMLFVRAAKGEIQRVRGKLRQAAQLDQEMLQQLGQIPADIIKIKAFGRLARLSYEWNQLDQAEHYVQQALELAGRTRREVFARAAYLALAWSSWARGQADEAFEAFEQAKEVARRMGGEYPKAEVDANLVRLWLAQHDALTDVEQARSAGSGLSAPAPSLGAATSSGLAAAIEWANAQNLDPDGELPYEKQIVHLAVCRVLIAQNRPEQAIRMLERMLAAAEAHDRMGEVVEMLAIKALAHQAQYQTNHAFTAAIRALTLAEPEGYIRTFVDEGSPMAHLLLALRQRPSAVSPAYLDTLLAAFNAGDRETSRQAASAIAESPHLPISASPNLPASQAPVEPLRPSEGNEAIHYPTSSSQPLAEPLSKREQEILSLMAEGLTNTEIAQQMIISPQTVKVHTRNIYGKLGVNGRRQAVAKARALGLLS